MFGDRVKSLVHAIQRNKAKFKYGPLSYNQHTIPFVRYTGQSLLPLTPLAVSCPLPLPR